MKYAKIAAKFNEYCSTLVVRAQETSKFQPILDFAGNLSSYVPQAGQAVDVSLLHELGAKLTAAVHSGNSAEIKSALHEVLENTQDGGGSLYSSAKSLFEDLAKSMQPAAPKPSTPAWLEQFKSNKPNWLDQEMANRDSAQADKTLQDYFEQENAKYQADEDIAGMAKSLSDGSSIKL